MGPTIDYPCSWSYRLIGESEAAIQAAVAAILGDIPHTLTRSNRSREGRFVSFVLELTVRDEAQRLDLHERLGAAPAIRMVL